MQLLRQQQYPLPPLISYKIPRIRVLCRVSGQFADWQPLAMHNRFLGVIVGTSNGTHHTVLNPPKPMSTPFFKANLPTQLSEEDVTKLDNICLEVTKQFFEEKYAHLIIDQLKYCRTFQKGYYKTTPDFRHFSGIYHMIKKHSSYDDYVVFRKYLQTLSAVYRWHFAKYDNVTAYNYLHERVKIETHCEHCGSLSKALIDRLIKENLWAV